MRARNRPPCRKKGWHSQGRADLELHLVRQRRLREDWNGPIECRTYYHQGCGKWHLTSMQLNAPKMDLTDESKGGDFTYG